MTNTTLGKEGLGQQPWWVVEWMELINSYRYKKRLERAWIYAREGNVLSIRFEGLQNESRARCPRGRRSRHAQAVFCSGRS